MLSEVIDALGSEGAFVPYLLIAAALVVVRYLLARRKKPLWPVTIALGAIALCVYVGTMHPKIVRFVQTGPWPTFHYFLGAKYFEELEYHRLYRMMLLADVESGTNHLVSLRHVRQPEDYELAGRVEALEMARRERPIHFTDERWEEFKADWVNMAPRNSPKRWQRGMTDRGFNPPPFWVALPGLVAQDVPVDRLGEKPGRFMRVRNWDLVIKFAAYLLVALLVGLDAALLCFIFAELAPYNSTHQIGTYFQFMFFSALLMAMAFYRRRWHVAAGLLLAASAMLRIFPLVFVAGPGLVWLRKLFATRSLPRRETAFLASFAVGCLLFVGIGLAQGRGVQTTVTFVQNIAMHADHQKFDGNKFGLKRMLAVPLDDPWSKASTGPYARRIEAFEQNRPYHRFLVLWMFGLLALVCLSRVDEDDWVLPMSYLLFFGLMVSSRYYYLALVVFLIPPRHKRDQGFATLAAALVLAVNALWWVLPEFEDQAGRRLFDGRAVFTALNFAYFAILNLLGLYLLGREDLARARSSSTTRWRSRSSRASG